LFVVSVVLACFSLFVCLFASFFGYVVSDLFFARFAHGFSTVISTFNGADFVIVIVFVIYILNALLACQRH